MLRGEPMLMLANIALNQGGEGGPSHCDQLSSIISYYSYHGAIIVSNKHELDHGQWIKIHLGCILHPANISQLHFIVYFIIIVESTSYHSNLFSFSYNFEYVRFNWSSHHFDYGERNKKHFSSFTHFKPYVYTGKLTPQMKLITCLEFKFYFCSF